jgi:NhaP-type Na+/H+ or K+/H+ antiporter
MNRRIPRPMHDPTRQPDPDPGPPWPVTWEQRGTFQVYEQPPDYRIWVIAAAIAGALFSVIAGTPAGLAALYYSRRVRRTWEADDQQGAVTASRAARGWAITSTCLDAAGIIAVTVIISRGGNPAGWM